jgi:hypothetical protein
MSGLFEHLLGSKLVQVRVGLVLKVFQHLNLGKLTPIHQAQVGTNWHKIQNIAECRTCRMLQKTSEILYFTRCFNMARFVCKKITSGGALRLRTMLPLLLS